jgi:hypothetical protein
MKVGREGRVRSPEGPDLKEETMKNPRFRGITLVLSALMLLGTMFATSAFADGREVEKHGQCSGSAHWELEADHEGGRLEMEFEVNAQKAGVNWKVKLSHDGSVFDALVRTTNHEGNFEVDRYVKNTSGPDTLGARAISPSGQICKGQLSI